MTKQKPLSGRRGKSRFLIVMILLSLLLTSNLIVFMVRLMAEEETYINEYSSMMRALESGDYQNIADMVHDNKAKGEKTLEDTSEFEAFTDYYEAATLYQAYKVAGQEEKALAQEIIMKESLAKIDTPEIKQAADQYLESLQ